MKEMFQAIKHCYHGTGSCKDCPYEGDREKCRNLFINIETIFTKIGEFIEFDDVKNIIKIVLKGGKQNETKD